MKAEQQIILHIGFHKTGSTALQSFLGTYRKRLVQYGFHFHRGIHRLNNHVELHAAAMKEERMSPFKMKFQIIDYVEYRNFVRSRIHQSIQSSPCATHIFSSEGLSYLRYEEEFAHLKSLLPSMQISVVAYLREREGYRQSYEAEMLKHPPTRPVSKDSYAYTEGDSWLYDFDTRIGGFLNAFGSSNVTQIGYDDELAQNGSIIPAFLAYLDISSVFVPHEWNRFYLNSRSIPKPNIVHRRVE